MEPRVGMKTIFFDLGGVLLNFSHEKMFQNIADLCLMTQECIKKEFVEYDLGSKYEQGKMTSKEVHQHFSKISSKNIDYQKFLHAGANIFSVKKEVVALLPLLKEAGKKLIVLSNTYEAHFAWIQSHFDFLRYFDDFILSYEVKTVKPDKKIYLYALKKAKTRINNCFYIDDTLENIHAAQKIGIDSHLFQGVEELIQALQIRKLLPVNYA